jgi:nucleotide-binding universal stress UspA family protein
MYQKILVATDGSELASQAVRTGAQLAKELNAALTIVTVTEPLPPVDAAAQAESGDTNPFGRYQQLAERSAMKSLGAAERLASGLGVTCGTVHIKDSYPALGIVETAEEQGADLIVMASHGRRGLTRLLLGSVTNEVLVRSKIPVLVCR